MTKPLGRARLRGHWDYAALAPVAVGDPEHLLRLAAPYGGLPGPSLRRLHKSALLSDKQATRLVRGMFAAGDRKGLRELERLLSGGGTLWESGYENLVVNEGLNHILDVVLSGGTQDTSWFIGLLDADAAPAANWTATQVAGDDFVAYDETDLQAFTDGGVSGQSVSNSASPATFTCSTNSSVVGGAFLIGTNAKGTPAGTLYAAGTFTGGDKNLDDGDSLEVTASFSSADDGV